MIAELLGLAGLVKNNRPLSRTEQLIRDGSDTYEYTNAAIIAAAAVVWLDVAALFPQSRIFFPLDSIEVINNSAQPITLFLNSHTVTETVPSYMIKPINGKAVRQFGLRNDGLVDIAAGEIIVHLKRLPPDVQVVVTGGTVR